MCQQYFCLLCNVGRSDFSVDWTVGHIPVHRIVEVGCISNLGMSTESTGVVLYTRYTGNRLQDTRSFI